MGNGLLNSICAATSLAVLLYEGATTAHSLFRNPVEDEMDVDDIAIEDEGDGGVDINNVREQMESEGNRDILFHELEEELDEI